MSTKQEETTALIIEQLVKSGIKLVASLPDDWVSDLIHTIDSDRRFTHVPVNREESAIGLCSGAYFGGIPSLALMGASGLMTCVYALTKIKPVVINDADVACERIESSHSYRVCRSRWE